MNLVTCLRFLLTLKVNAMKSSFLPLISSYMISKWKSTLSLGHQWECSHCRQIWITIRCIHLNCISLRNFLARGDPEAIASPCHLLPEMLSTRGSRTVGCGINCSQDCFRSTRKVFFRSRVSQQLPEDTTHPKLGVGTKSKNQLISVWLPEPP